MYDAGDVADIFRKQSLFERKNVAQKVLDTFSDSVPLILVRQKNEMCPRLKEYKFIVKRNSTWINFTRMIQSSYIDNSNIYSTQALHFMIGKVYPSSLDTFQQLYDIYADQDGFLYVYYSVQDAFGDLPEVSNVKLIL